MAHLIIIINIILIKIIAILLSNFRPSKEAAAASYNYINVVSSNYGARGDGRTDSSQAFLKAWGAACSSAEPSLIYIPDGHFLINSSLTFKGPCKNRINIRILGTLFAPTDFRALAATHSWILFIQVNRITLTGGGTLDAKAAAFWACRRNTTSSSSSCPASGARSLTFNWANDIVIDGLKSMNSQFMHLVINSCNNVMVRNLRILAPDESPNTDGIHVQHSTGVTISTCTIRTGDDCISVGPNTKNLWMERIQCGPGHGVSIGSLARDYSEGGVQNVTLTNSVFTASENGLRIKTWARPTTAFVKNIHYRNIVMKNVHNPIIIDQDYCPNNQACPGQSSSGVKISDITYQNIKGTSATPVAVLFKCSKSNPCRGIKLQDISLSYMNRPAQSSCLNTNHGSSLRVVSPKSCLPVSE
ncbi:polygalacturonase-like [Impatiens glandulifera]|uniref:polygalacturonase-like n=1 Tax=Impatiens glandulifera TaxID=253017 RepID=UPI001FB09C7E|nr:polygalacturonase-like [Impatiens glandulifera]